jgi:hypothetical protein
LTPTLRSIGPFGPLRFGETVVIKEDEQLKVLIGPYRSDLVGCP